MNLQLKRLRKQNGNLTQEQLAQALGTTKRVVGSWERGETQITLEDAIEVCRVLNCTPNDLCGWYIDNPQDALVAKADAPAGLSRDETALISDYRSCTPERKRWVADAARDQQRLSQEQDTAGESFAEAV